MVEIPLKTWLQINNMTRIDNRVGWDTDDDTPFRVAAVLLKYLPTPMTREKILTTLGIKLEDYGIAFDTMARAVDRDHQNWSALANFDLEEFWTSASLENWLSACDEALCHGVWHTPMPFLERVQLMSQANNILPCVSSPLLSLGLGAQRQGYVEFGYIHIFTHAVAITQPWIPVHLHCSESSLVLTTICFSGYEVLKQLERLGPSFAGYRGVLQNYRDDVQILVREVKKSIEVLSLSEESWLSLNLVEEFFDQPYNLKKCARAHEARSLCRHGKTGSLPPQSGVTQGSPVVSWDGCTGTFGSLTGCKHLKAQTLYRNANSNQIHSCSISRAFRSRSRQYLRLYCDFLVLQASILDAYLFWDCKRLANNWRGEGLEISGKGWFADKVSALKS
jgi:hypothetical protein